MEFYPPINVRTTEELLNIISDNDKWNEEIQLLAEKELVQRNISQGVISEEKCKRIKILQEYKEKWVKTFEKNRKQSYSITEMILIIAFFPFSLIFHLNPLSEFWELDRSNYKRKIWQRVILIMLSSFIWFQILKLII